MTCSSCGKRMGFREHSSLRVKPDGGRYPLEDSYDQWIACNECGAKADFAKTDLKALDRIALGLDRRRQYE